MIAKRPPFKSKSMKELYKKVITSNYAPLNPNLDIPNELIVMLNLIFQANPRMRPSCNTLLN
jgi:hypothetical protein